MKMLNGQAMKFTMVLTARISNVGNGLSGHSTN